VELDLFRSRSFAAANAGTVVFSVGFYALLLANVLFVTGVWGWSVLRTGVALTPGAVMAALVAPPAGRLADRYGQRALALPGGLVFAAGAGWLAYSMTTSVGYWTDLLPGMVLTGTGIGLSISSFGSAAVAELPHHRFATGSAITSCARQVGAVLGIAVLLAVLAAHPGKTALSGFHLAWTIMAGTGMAAAIAAVALGRVHAREVDGPGLDPSARPTAPAHPTPTGVVPQGAVQP
jgi:MFS family permease